MSNDDRAERLRQRRKQSQEKASERSETDDSAKQSESSKPSETSEPDKTDKPDETSESESVKTEREGTYMYLPAEQKSELSYQFKRLSAEYEREFGAELEKNRHFYPLVVSYGLDSLDSWDSSDLQDALDDLGL